MEEKEGLKLDFGAIDFTPDWAKRDAGVNVGKVRQFKEERGERVRGGEGRPDGGRKPMGDRKPFRKSFDRKPRFEDRPKPLDAEVKILPETKALGTIIRKLQADTHAYKLKDLAYFFLDNPSSVLVKVMPKTETAFYQCKVCGFVSMSEAETIEHIVACHIGEYYDSKEVDVEPPKGNFNCVAKCGLSGVLLGPPNIHEFNSVVKEMLRTRYPEMSETEYRSRIVMVREAEAIEEWRKGATKKTMFFAKGTMDQEGAAQYTREQAEGEFRRTFLSSMLEKPKTLMITVEQAMKSSVKPLIWLIRDALEVERRAPYAMCFALRGAFHHRKLNFFRANDSRGPEFVINHELKEFDATHAIPELASAAKFLMEHPCCDKSEFPTDIADFEQSLGWLVSTGHAVSYTNGVYSAVEKFPKYGPQWKKRGVKPVENAPQAEAAPQEEQPAVEAESKNENEVIKEEEKKNEVATELAE